MHFQSGHYIFHSNRHELHSTIVDSVVYLLVGGSVGIRAFVLKLSQIQYFTLSLIYVHAIAVHEWF